MNNRFQNNSELESSSSIDMSPLIDIVFILLIFFIVTTVFSKESGVEIDKPQAISARQLDNRTIIFAVNASQQVYYLGANIGMAGIRGALEQIVDRNQRAVVIQADKKVSAEVLLQLIDQVKLSGVASVSLSALPAAQ